MPMNINIEAISEAYNSLPEQRHWKTYLTPKRKFDMEACVLGHSMKIKFAVDLDTVNKISYPIVIAEAHNCIAILLRVINELERKDGK